MGSRGGAVDALAPDPQLTAHLVRATYVAQSSDERGRVLDGNVRVEEDDGALGPIAGAFTARQRDAVARSLRQPSWYAVEAGANGRWSRHRAGRVGHRRGGEGAARRA